MNHLILDDDTNGIQSFCSQSQTFTWFYVIVTSLDKALVCEHSNISCRRFRVLLFVFVDSAHLNSNFQMYHALQMHRALYRKDGL